MEALKSVAYHVKDRVAYITLNRPERMNAIDNLMPSELRMCVEEADHDDKVHVMVVQGAGENFCAGYDLVKYSEEKTSATQKMPWDPMVDFDFMMANTQSFSALRTCRKPTIAKVRGHAVAGGSDIALSADLVVMATDAKIGYMPARVWGVPTTAMWAARVGMERAKLMMFTGKMIDGAEAERIGLVCQSVPAVDLDGCVDELARNIAAVPKNQLAMTKIVINDQYDAQIRRAQVLSTFFDGVARHSPEGMHFKKRSEEVGFKQAVKERDSGEPIAAEAERPSFPRRVRTVLVPRKEAKL